MSQVIDDFDCVQYSEVNVRSIVSRLYHTSLYEPTSEDCCPALACQLRKACHERIYAGKIIEKHILDQNYGRDS